MGKPINVSIDLTKIDKARIKVTEKGQKFYNITLIETPNAKYGNDFMVVEDITKAERDGGKKGTILGNAKYAGGGGSSNTPKPPASAQDWDL